MLIGYARVPTHEQTLNLQQDALTKAGCTKVFTDTASGAKTERKGLAEALAYVRKGDTFVVWRLDRLGRSLPHLITTMTDLEERGIGFKSLKGGLYGEYPSLEEDKLLEGNLHFNNDFRGLYATLLEDWMGLDAKPIVNGSFEKMDFISKR
jgi:DNA invertase Pin-like site-specific DNA recombinase